jgi:ABC-2 type transport system permease protein
MMFPEVLSTEFLKLRRTRITWILGLVYCFGPLMMALMMVVLKNPDLGRRMGLVAAKAQLTVGMADWPTFLMLSSMMIVVGMIVLGIEESFIFGREYAEGTAKNMLTLPVERFTLVAAKLTVAAVWYLCMALVVYAESIGLGLLIGLPGLSADLLVKNILLALKLIPEVLLLSSVPAWIAVAGRGYLAPVGFTIFTLLLGDFFAHTGWGPWFPWSIIFLTSGAAGPVASLPGMGSIIVLVGIFFAGAAATYMSLDRTDNTQ